MIPTSNIVVLIFVILIGLAVLIGPAFYLAKKHKCGLRTFFYGILAFAASNLLLVGWVGNLIVSTTSLGNVINGKSVYYGIAFVAILTGLFEEVAKYLVFKKSFVGELTNDYESLMYGAGHISIYLFKDFIFIMIQTLIVFFVINSGDTSNLREETIPTFLGIVPGYFWGTLILFIFRVIYQIALSVIVWFSVKKSKLEWFIGAIIGHIIAEVLIISVAGDTGSKGLKVTMTEGITNEAVWPMIGTFAYVVLLCVIAMYIFKRNRTEDKKAKQMQENAKA